MGTLVAGLVLRVRPEDSSVPPPPLCQGACVFLSATEARLVVELGAHTMVDRALGVGIGVASVQGQLVTLLDLDPDGTTRRDGIAGVFAADPRVGILADIETGESVLLTGGRVLATGLFPAALERDAIEHGTDIVETLSVTKLYRKVETRIWENRALASQPRPPVSRRSEGRYP